MTVWFTADTHFGHAGVIRMNDRPFEGVVEMREVLIANWNAAVRPDDEVWHLGDFAYRSEPGEAGHIFERLNGRKNLIAGNHDSLAITTGMDWKSVSDIRQIAVDGHRVVLCHYPLLEWPAYFRQAIHLFGHVHGRRAGVGRSCDVGIDVWGYRPVALPEILARIGDAVND